MNADGSDRKVIFQATRGSDAFDPNWSPDGQRVIFGHGSYFQGRKDGSAKVMVVGRNGGPAEDLTTGKPNSGFPSYSPDGKQVVFRTWGEGAMGLRILNLRDHSIRVLTTTSDNLPYWSPDGSRILFTRNDGGNYDIFTIRPDGTDLKRLTTYPANDAHATWTADGRHVLWNSGEYGFKDEAALYDQSFQPYGTIWIMNPDGSGKRQITDSRWEDSMAVYVPAKK